MRRLFLTGLLSLGLALPMAGLLHVAPVKAEDAASFYKGKKIKLSCPTSLAVAMMITRAFLLQ
jgi:hypothetical protein